MIEKKTEIVIALKVSTQHYELEGEYKIPYSIKDKDDLMVRTGISVERCDIGDDFFVKVAKNLAESLISHLDKKEFYEQANFADKFLG
jgi:hypothetical protein